MKRRKFIVTAVASLTTGAVIGEIGDQQTTPAPLPGNTTNQTDTNQTDTNQTDTNQNDIEEPETTLKTPTTTITRPPDTGSVTVSGSSRRGLHFTTSENFDKLRYQISSKTTDINHAYLYRIDDKNYNSTLLTDRDISGLTSGDIFTVTYQYQSGTRYAIAADGLGSSYSYGYFSASYPYSGEEITIKSGADGDNAEKVENEYAWIFSGIGEMGL